MGQSSSQLLTSVPIGLLVSAGIAQAYMGHQLWQSRSRTDAGSDDLKQLVEEIENYSSKLKKELEDQEASNAIEANAAQDYSGEPIIGERKQPCEEEAELFKICVTGGPCGGKTSGLVYIQEKMKELGFLVYVVPEAATLIANGGGMLDMDNYNNTQAISFQTNLLKLQIRLENSMTAIAKLNKKKAIVLCDRGLMDGKAYVDTEKWNKLLDANNLNEVIMRDDRYDLVIHLVSAADGAETFYNLSNVARFESETEARVMDKKTQQAWLGHPNHCIIDNKVKSFEEKLQRVLYSVKNCVGIPTIANKFTKKFLLKGSSSHNPFKLLGSSVKKFFIEDAFLEREEGSNQIQKLRRRGQDQNYAYILSSSIVDKVSKTSQNTEIFSKKLLSRREYSLMLTKSDHRRNTVMTQREVFLYKDNVFILDNYMNIKEGFSILKVKLKSQDEPFEFPPDFAIAKEISEDLGYKRATIAKKGWYFSKGDALLIQQK